MRLLSLLLLFALGCGKSTSYWQEQLKSPEPVERLHAVCALRDRPKESKVAVAALIEALSDEDSVVRRDAARALGGFGHAAQPALPALKAHLDDAEPSVRKAAAAAIKKIEA